jgi:hypothetical protein
MPTALASASRQKHSRGRASDYFHKKSSASERPRGNGGPRWWQICILIEAKRREAQNRRIWPRRRTLLSYGKKNASFVSSGKQTERIRNKVIDYESPRTASSTPFTSPSTYSRGDHVCMRCRAAAPIRALFSASGRICRKIPANSSTLPAGNT